MNATLCRMPVDHSAPEPLYQQLAELIRGQIRRGELRPRTAIPSITALAAEHDIAVVTVRRAISMLVKDGWLTTTPGRGTYVAERPGR